MIKITPTISISEAEIKEEFIHSSGPGGQNVNKVATAVQLRFDVRRSPSLPEEVRRRLYTLARRRISRDGILVITARRFRTQERNRQDALERLIALLRHAAQKPVPRRPTRPTAAARARRLAQKRRRADDHVQEVLADPEHCLPYRHVAVEHDREDAEPHLEGDAAAPVLDKVHLVLHAHLAWAGADRHLNMGAARAGALFRDDACGRAGVRGGLREGFQALPAAVRRDNGVRRRRSSRLLPAWSWLAATINIFLQPAAMAMAKKLIYQSTKPSPEEVLVLKQLS